MVLHDSQRELFCIWFLIGTQGDKPNIEFPHQLPLMVSEYNEKSIKISKVAFQKMQFGQIL